MDVESVGSPLVPRKKSPSASSLLYEDNPMRSPLLGRTPRTPKVPTPVSPTKTGNLAGNVGGGSDGTLSPSSIGVKAGFKSFLASQWQVWQRRIPALKRVQELILSLPPRVRMALVFFWFCWKIFLILAFLIVFIQKRLQADNPHDPDVGAFVSSDEHSTILYNNDNPNATKVLYIVTSLAEYNNGKRMTIEGQDRFLYQLFPVMMENVETMVCNPDLNLQVDLYLICAYELRPEREAMIRNRLPAGVGFQFWDDALPLSYDVHNTTGAVRPNLRALARNHRYVVRDKLEHYDMFVAFEDDMRVTGLHVEHYWNLSLEIERLRIEAPIGKEMDSDNVDQYKETKFFGTMTKGQLERVVPGFFRVEVLVNETDRGAQTSTLPVPIDHDFGDEFGGHRIVDPSICCHVHMEPNYGTIPEQPPADDLVVWETNIKAFSLRQMPSESSLLDWVVLMMGPGKFLSTSDIIGGYWSGREGAFKYEKRPSGGEPKLVAQQGGWMATKEQLIRMNNKLCLASFLPPFDDMGAGNDGLDPQNVEFWSGSYQFFTGAANHCNMQRIMSINPDHFSKHLLYHTANNKQKQLPRGRMVRANNLFGQLNSVMKMAQKAKDDILNPKT